MPFRLRALFGRSRAAEEPLRGRPPIRREKAYAADSGYVYQYTYEGYRPVLRSGVGGRDFVFRCTSDRSAHFSITVFAPDESFSEWEVEQDRELNEVERYAVVKMHLFETFDDLSQLQGDMVFEVAAEDVRAHVETLDL